MFTLDHFDKLDTVSISEFSGNSFGAEECLFEKKVVFTSRRFFEDDLN